jgi:presqualene diphosphate synthase
MPSNATRRMSNIEMSARDNQNASSIPLADEAAWRHVRAVTQAAGSSFYSAMRILPTTRRDAMFAIYAFCREVDDIADGDQPTDERSRLLDEWRAEIDRVYDGAPTLLTARALVEAVARFDLRREDFMAVIDGMQMDIDQTIAAPTMAELETYCQRVAGAVGLLSIRAFGISTKRAEEFALALGTALQLTNILRDLKQDAVIHRLYLPRELLLKHGIESRDPDEVLAHPAIGDVCTEIAAIARERYDLAIKARADCPGKALRPAMVMMMMYRKVLDRLVQRGWRDLDTEVHVSSPEKIWVALRYGLM